MIARLAVNLAMSVDFCICAGVQEIMAAVVTVSAKLRNVGASNFMFLLSADYADTAIFRSAFSRAVGGNWLNLTNTDSR